MFWMGWRQTLAAVSNGWCGWWIYMTNVGRTLYYPQRKERKELMRWPDAGIFIG